MLRGGLKPALQEVFQGLKLLAADGPLGLQLVELLTEMLLRRLLVGQALHVPQPLAVGVVADMDFHAVSSTALSDVAPHALRPPETSASWSTESKLSRAWVGIRIRRPTRMDGTVPLLTAS